MTDILDPVPDNWYHDLVEKRTFRVVDIDEDDSIIEIELADGSLDEIDLDQWNELELEVVDGPTDPGEAIDLDEEDDDLDEYR